MFHNLKCYPPAGSNPWCLHIVFIGSKANPTGSPVQKYKHTAVLNHGWRQDGFLPIRGYSLYLLVMWTAFFHEEMKLFTTLWKMLLLYFGKCYYLLVGFVVTYFSSSEGILPGGVCCPLSIVDTGIFTDSYSLYPSKNRKLFLTLRSDEMWR